MKINVNKWIENGADLVRYALACRGVPKRPSRITSSAQVTAARQAKAYRTRQTKLPIQRQYDATTRNVGTSVMLDRNEPRAESRDGMQN
jgi:hypothetical protein